MRPEKFIENFSTHLKNVIARAISLATSLNHENVSPAHILFTMSEEAGSIGAEILFRIKLEPKNILKYLESNIPEKTSRNSSYTKTTDLPELNKSAKQALERAMLIAYERGNNYIGTEHLLYGVLKIPDKEIKSMLSQNKITIKSIIEEVETVLQSTSHFPDMENVKDMMDQMQDVLGSQNPPLSAQAGMPIPTQNNMTTNKSGKGNSALDIFTTNLTDKKIASKFDPIIGREKEIDRLIHILSRRTKNNPVLVGEPGVGKTAIAEGLAKRITEGKVPDILKRKKILSLDLTLLIAGTIYRGEFESRLKQIIDEVSGKPDYILFIDELHNIIGAGSNQGTMDAANILKPALSRGLLHCIGATTIDEYKKHITSDPALERRFQSIQIDEPSLSETLEILKGIKSHYEDFHHVNFLDEALEAAVEMSSRYIHDNFLPDKAIDLMDEAAACARSKRKSSLLDKKQDDLQNQLEMCREQKELAIAQENFDNAVILKEKEINLSKKINLLEKQIAQTKKPAKKKIARKDIAQILSNKLNIPLDYLLSNEWEHLKDLPENLKAHIVGQDNVIDKIVQNLRQSYLRLSPKKRPFASFLFAGPSGVGKTELAKVLARELYRDEKALIKLDMSEFAEGHSVSKLLGSPAGYIGYKERNRFTDELQKKPYAVLLFDEFDKAHTDVQKLLLQILDEGELTDSHGKKTYFHHSTIVITTNLGSEFYKSAGIGFSRDFSNKSNTLNNEEINSTVIQKIKEDLGSELVNRIQTTCLFSPLSREDVQTIIKKNLENLNNILQDRQQIKITADNKALDNMAKNAYTENTGARNVEQVIQEIVHELIVDLLQKQKNQPTAGKKEYILTKTADSYMLV